MTRLTRGIASFLLSEYNEIFDNAAILDSITECAILKFEPSYASKRMIEAWDKQVDAFLEFKERVEHEYNYTPSRPERYEILLAFTYATFEEFSKDALFANYTIMRISEDITRNPCLEDLSTTVKDRFGKPPINSGSPGATTENKICYKRQMAALSSASSTIISRHGRPYKSL